MSISLWLYGSFTVSAACTEGGWLAVTGPSIKRCASALTPQSWALQLDATLLALASFPQAPFISTFNNCCLHVFLGCYSPCWCVCRLRGSGQSHLTSVEFDFFSKSTFSQMTVFTSFWWQLSAAEMTWESVVFVPAHCVRHSSTMLAIIEQPQHVIAGLFSLKNSMER